MDCRPAGAVVVAAQAGLLRGGDTDIEDIIAALQHSRKGAEPDVKCSAVPADGDHPGVISTLSSQGGGDTGGNRRGIFKHVVYPGHPPG